MKKYFLILLFFNFSFSQIEIKYDEQKALYCFSKDYELKTTEEDLMFKLKTLGFSEISNERHHVFCKGYFSKIIMLTSLQVFYNIIIKFEEDKINFYISNFIIDDKRFSPVPLENIRTGKKRWISEINEKLPSIINSILN